MEVTALYEIRRPGSEDLYVGIANDPVQRWRSHKSYANRGGDTRLARSMRKYGCEAFTFQVVAGFPTRAHALLAERAAVIHLRPNLNTSPGGDASPTKSAETRAKISAAAKARGAQWQTQTPEAQAKRSASLKGRKLTWVDQDKRKAAAQRAHAELHADPDRKAAHAAATSAGRKAAMADPVRKAQWLAKRCAAREAKKAAQ